MEGFFFDSMGLTDACGGVAHRLCNIPDRLRMTLRGRVFVPARGVIAYLCDASVFM